MKTTTFLFVTVIFLATNTNAQEIDGGVFSRYRCIFSDDCPTSDNVIVDVTCPVGGPCDGSAGTELRDSTGSLFAAGSVGYSGPSLTPTISAYAYVPEDNEPVYGRETTLLTTHWGFQKYTLKGNQAVINGTLTFSRSENERGFSSAGIIAFKMNGDVFDLSLAGVDPCGSTIGYRILLCLRGAFGSSISNATDIQVADFEEFGAIGPAVVNGMSHTRLNINGEQGDVWFVGSFLQWANEGDYFDSRNTVAFEFEDPTSVEPSLEQILPSGGTFAPAPAVGTTLELLNALAVDVSNLNFQAGISNALDAKLEVVNRVIKDLNEQNNVAAVNGLTAFIYFVQAQRGNQMQEADADMLIASAIAIISSIGG